MQTAALVMLDPALKNIFIFCIKTPVRYVAPPFFVEFFYGAKTCAKFVYITWFVNQRKKVIHAIVNKI